MQYALTLTADPVSRPLGPGHAREAVTALHAAGARHLGTTWLGRGCALDLVLAAPAAAPVRASVDRALAGAGVDIAIQPAAGRRRRLLVADMDSTVIGQETLDEHADMAGLRERVAPITDRAMRGEIDFETALRDRVRLLAGHPAALLATLVEQRITLTPGAGVLVRTMRAHGARTALVSGGFTAVTGPVARRAGFDDHHANSLVVVNGRLAGTVEDPVLGADAKRAILHRLCGECAITPADALAVGDGANDMPMLAAAGTGVAFRARPRVAAAARFRVDHGDLTALLYLQGFSEDEFAGHGAVGNPRASQPG